MISLIICRVPDILFHVQVIFPYTLLQQIKQALQCKNLFTHNLTLS